MSASPAITTQVPVADPAPEAGAQGASGPADGTIEEEPPRKRRRKLLVLFLLLLAFMFLLSLAIWYLLFRQPITPPLPGVPVSVLPTYSTAVYGASRPTGVAVTSDGERVFITETGGDRIVRAFDRFGTEVAQLRPPLSTGTDHTPVYLAISPVTGEVYVTDRLAGALYIYSQDGTYARSLTPPADLKGWQPLAIAFDAAGQLYVSNLGGEQQQILVFDKEGRLLRSFGTDAGMSFPNGIGIDAVGNVYVTDSNNGRLLVFAPDGTLAAQVGRGAGEGNLGLPRGVTVDGSGLVYVTDASGQAVFAFRALKPGERRLGFVGMFGTQGVTEGAFEFPNQITVDSRGRVYIADTGNDRVQIWSH
jgi:tripartite motif-containing protein 71